MNGMVAKCGKAWQGMGHGRRVISMQRAVWGFSSRQPGSCGEAESIVWSSLAELKTCRCGSNRTGVDAEEGWDARGLAAVG